MSDFTFAVISDTHVRLDQGDKQSVYPSDRLANDRNRAVAKMLSRYDPDLIIHLGDVVHPIPHLPDHAVAVRLAREIYRDHLHKMHVLPGNHDVGDKPNAPVPAPDIHQGSDRQFLENWGQVYSSFDREGCHFVLLNSSLFNSGLAKEKEQQDWLEADLENNRQKGRRLFIFMHYPLFICDPDEDEHYDNIAQPARARLLDLISSYNAEAVFAGHAHCFFCDRFAGTNLYVAPSTTFVRPDYAELFHIGPAEEYGRDDTGKLGFFLVEVSGRGHRIKPVRTQGRAAGFDQDAGLRLEEVFANNEAQKGASFPFGVFLRHPWVEPLGIPYDNLDEFNRKQARNDYQIQALLELGIDRLRLPLGDLKDPAARKRLRALQDLGFGFSFFSVGPPTRKAMDLLARRRDLVSAWEILSTREQLHEVIRVLNQAEAARGMKIYLSKIETAEDQTGEQGLNFSHFSKHGFGLDEASLVSGYLKEMDLPAIKRGFVFRLPDAALPHEGVMQAARTADDLGVPLMLQARMPRGEEGLVRAPYPEISNRIAELLVSAAACANLEVYLDTLVDHDRGYYPRHGLLNRRYNPRPGFHVFQNLRHALKVFGPVRGLARLEAGEGFRALALASDQGKAVLLTAEHEGGQVSLDLSAWPGPVPFEGFSYWQDLMSGQVHEFKSSLKADAGGVMRFEWPSPGNAPLLLIFGK